MNTKYIDTSVLLCATMKYSGHRGRAYSIIYDGIRGNSIKISNTTFERLYKIYNRRKIIFKDSFSDITIKKCIGKTPADFRTCFTKGSTRDHLDDEQLTDIFDDIVRDYLDMFPTNIFSNQKSDQFCDKVYDVLGYNKYDLNLLIGRLQESEVIFSNDFKKEEQKIYEIFKKSIKETRYKIDIKILSEYIAHGINSGMDFEIVTADQNFLESTRLEKINNIIKKEYGPSYDNIIIPIHMAYGIKPIKATIKI